MKNKSMNKILALGVVAAMTAGMLAGCGSSASTTDGAAAGTEAASNSAASNGEVPTLVWWTVGGTPADDFDQAVSQISDYAEEKIGVRIDVKIAGWADYDTKMNNIINTGEYFDLMFVNNTNYTKFVNQTLFSLRHRICTTSSLQTCGKVPRFTVMYMQYRPTRILP